MAGEIPDVVIGEIIETDWGNDIRDRTVQRYADQAELDALNPTPTQGDLAYLVDQGSFQIYNGTSWRSRFSSDGLRTLSVDVGAIIVSNGALADPNPKLQASGSAAIPAFATRGDGTTGFYNIADGAWGFSSNTLNTVRIHEQGMSLTVHPTAGNAANTYMRPSDGLLFESTSARRFKTDIVSAAPLADLVLEPVTFTFIESGDEFIGFIADDMPDERLIERLEDGQVQNYDLRGVVAVLTAKVNALADRVATLEAQVDGS